MKAEKLPSPPAGTLVESAYQALRRRILDNEWPPGTQALERDVAQALGMSRTPVREAMIRLQNDGLVEVIPRHGMRVLSVSPADMREIYEILAALESAAIEAITRRSPGASELAGLSSAAEAMARAIDADDLDAWAIADEAFHMELVTLAGNRHLKQTVTNYWDRVHRARMFSLRLRPKPVKSTQEHRQLIELIRAGDVEGAVNLNRAHRSRASSELTAILERFKVVTL